MQKIPSYAMIFYTINTLVFACGAMDSMMQMMMGTSDILGYGAAYRVEPTNGRHIRVLCLVQRHYCCTRLPAVLHVEGDGQVPADHMAAVFLLGSFACMYFMYSSGVLGVTGIAQYGVMNAASAASLALYNVKNL